MVQSEKRMQTKKTKKQITNSAYIKRIYSCMIYLMTCALHNTSVDEENLKDIKLEHLLKVCRKHSVASMVCMALESTNAFKEADENIRAKWLEVKIKAIRKNMLMDAEYKALIHKMEKCGIWYMPLKGIILKEWYPKAGMREMSDHDILIDPSKREQVKDIFIKRGYQVEYYNEGNHDVYQKNPVYNYEIHVSLFHSNEKKFAKQYADIKERLLPVHNSKYQYKFTDEDFYIFVTVHAFKHYSEKGIGVRALSDFYVMNQKLKDVLNRNYVEEELLKLGINEFEKESRILAEKIFGNACPLNRINLSKQESEILLYYLESGTFGNNNNLINKRFENLNSTKGSSKGNPKLKYLLERIFPRKAFIKDSYPFVYKHLWIYPMFCLWRIVCKPFSNWGKIKGEIKLLVKKSADL